MLHKVLLIGLSLGLFVPDVRAVRQESQEALEKWREEAFNEGRRLFFQGEFEAAKQKFHEAFMISQQMPPEKLDLLSRNYEGLCYQYLDELDQALTLFEEVLRVRESLAGTWAGSPGYVADSLNNIGWAFYLKGDYNQALAYLKRAEVNIAKGVIQFTVSARTLGNLKSAGIPEELVEKLKLSVGKDCKDEEELLAFLKTIIGDEKVARYRPVFLKQFEYPVVDRTIWEEGRILTNLGAVYMALGDYSKAFKYLRYVVEQSETHNDKMCKTRTFQNLGDLERSWGDQTKALQYREQAVQVGREAYDQVYNRAYLVDALTDLGALYGQMPSFDRTHTIFQEALTVSRQLGTRRLMARTLVNLGNLARDQGQLEVAVGHHQQALTISQEIILRPMMGLALAELGWDSLESRRPLQRPIDHGRPMGRGLETAPTQAIQFFQRALEVGGETLPPEVRTRIYSGLAEAHETLNDLKKAAEYYRLTIESIEKVRVGTLTEARKIGYWQTKQETFERAISLLHRLHEKDPQAGYEAQAFAYTERARARAFHDLLAEAKVKVRRGLRPEVQQEEQAIFREIAKVRKKLLQENLSPAETAKLERDLARAEERLREFQQRLRLTHPAYAALQYPEPLNLDKVQQDVLRPDTLLLEFMLGGKRSFLWAVSKQECQMVALPGRAKIEKQVKHYRQVITSPPVSPASFARYFHRAYRLYDLLLKPIEKTLNRYEQLVIVPDGLLHYLPFETLVARPVTRTTVHPPLLLSTHRMSYASSASVLGLVQAQTGRRPLQRPTGRAQESPPTGFHMGSKPSGTGMQLLAYADPVFRVHHRGAEGAEGTQKKSRRTRRLSGETRLVNITRSRYREWGMNLDPLPYTREEVKNIAALYPRKASKVYVGPAATESSVKAEALDHFNSLHFATHGLIDEEVPARSGVVLSLVDQEDEDGILQMNEIFNLSLNADLVVLSACQSGLGKLVKGEGIIGLTRAFMYAGVSSVVVSLWHVRDASTAEFMNRFYRHLREGKSKPEALRQAKLDMIRSERSAYRFPYFWSPFVITGQSQ